MPAIIASVFSVVMLVTAAAGANRWVAVGNAASTAAAPNPNCTLVVPARPLTAQGLATPYLLMATGPADGPCHEANALQTAFVQGAAIDPATGAISVYDPLVIDAGTRPARPPVVPALPAGAVVAVWFGYNGNVLSLRGAGQAGGDPGTPASAAPSPAPNPVNGPAASSPPDAILQQAGCVAGEDTGGQFTSFSQVGACNAGAFFAAANKAISAGKLHVPSPGTARDGLPCLTTRSFALIDQDQSDNVTARYLATASGQVAQDTRASRQALGTGAMTLFNGSDNGLLDFFMDPALGCAPWTAPDLANGGAPATALPLDEIQAARYAGKVTGSGPSALVPENDPMTLDGNGRASQGKTSTYRSIMDMPALPAGQSPRAYCTDMEQIQGTRLQQDVNLLMGAPSPAPGTGDNLFTFVSARLQASFANLDCGSFGLANEVTTTADAAGVVVAACYRHQVAAITPGAGNPTRGMTTCPATTAPAPATPGPSGTTTAPVSATPGPSATASPAASPTQRGAAASRAPASPAASAPHPAATMRPARPAPPAPAPEPARPAQSPRPAQWPLAPQVSPAGRRAVPAQGPAFPASGRGWHDSGWSASARGSTWPGLGPDWARPSPRRAWLSAVLGGLLSGLLRVF